MTTLMLATKMALYDLEKVGLVPLNRDLTIKMPNEFADRLARAACRNSGHTSVLRVFLDHDAGGLFAEVE